MITMNNNDIRAQDIACKIHRCMTGLTLDEVHEWIESNVRPELRELVCYWFDITLFAIEERQAATIH